MLRSTARRAARTLDTRLRRGGTAPDTLPRRRARTTSLDVLTRMIGGAGATADAAAVFGAPVSSGNTTVIPVARVSAFTTMGGGSSRVPSTDGCGGGTVARVRPAGFLVLDGRGADYRAIREPVARLVVPLAVVAAVAAARIVGVSVRESRRKRRYAAEARRCVRCSTADTAHTAEEPAE
ncbi:GerW family sporulation protein [Nocardiopsis sp. LOL_012]|uniref:GerW family sporulation protein n=1 Tax=Nocardiopsis sp. LOL_012 TaxID=3345409 RepID=UPI003A8B6514